MKYIFIHGWSFSKDIWKDFYNLENSLFIDLPFHNGNFDYKKENILYSFSSDIFNLIESFNEDVFIIGWSLGATVSTLIALKRPKNLKRLILIGFSPKFKDEKLGHSPKNIKAFMFQLKRDFKNTVYQFRKTAVYNEFKDIPLPEMEGGIKILKEFIDLDITKDLKNIDVETVLIHGKMDKIISYKGSVFTKNSIKNSSLYLLDGNHAPFLNKSEVILKHLK